MNWSNGRSRLKASTTQSRYAPGLGQFATGGAGLRVGVVVVGIAGHVEPVPRPALAVGRRGQEPIDDLLERRVRTIGNERRDRFRGRREAGQVERGATDPGPPVRRMRGRDPLRPRRVQEEGIDLIGHVVRTVDSRGRLAPDGLERPPASMRGGRLGTRRRRRSGLRGWPGCPRRHPALERRDLAGGQLLLRRHLRFVEVAYRTDQQALVRGSRDDSRSALSPFEKRFPVRQPEAGLRFLFTVARLAFRDDQGADRFLEERDRRCVVGLQRERVERKLEGPDNDEPPPGRPLEKRSANPIVKSRS